MNKFVWLTVAVLSTCSGGCIGDWCMTQTYDEENATGQATAANGTVVLDYLGDDDGLLFGPEAGSFPTLEFDVPAANGAYSLTGLHAQVCSAAKECTTAEGVVVYTSRSDIGVDDFDAEMSFFTTPEVGAEPTVVGWVQVSAAKEESKVCKPVSGGGGLPVGLGDI